MSREILKHCHILWRENERSEYSGHDSPLACADPDHFATYPWPVTYRYNSRGFRGPEWPSNIDHAVWCLGDSFTAALGAPETHAWWCLLEQALGRPCINISLDGASNDWIARWAQNIIDEVQPRDMVIQWSFTHRRERDLREVLDPYWQDFYGAVRAESWPDCASWYDVHTLPTHIQQELQANPRFNSYYCEQDIESLRRIFTMKSTVQQDSEHTQTLIGQLEANKNSTRILHSHVPKWHPAPIADLAGTWIDEYDQVDFSRDGYHYDRRTAEIIVENILKIF